MTPRLKAQSEEIAQVMKSRGWTHTNQLADVLVMNRETIRKYARGYQPASELIMGLIRKQRGEESEVVVQESAQDDRQRLENYVAASGLSNEEFAKKLKESTDDLGLMLKGKKEIAKKILSKAKSISASAPHPNSELPTRPPVNEPIVMKTRELAIIGWAQAGDLVPYEDIIDYEKKVPWMIEDPKAFAIRIRGDSMNPPHPEGTIAIVTPSLQPRNEQLVIARLNDEGVVFKKLQIVDTKKKVFRLISYNKSYDPIERSGEDFLWIYPVRITYMEH